MTERRARHLKEQRVAVLLPAVMLVHAALPAACAAKANPSGASTLLVCDGGKAASSEAR